MYKKELAKTDSPPSLEASKFFFHEHPETFPSLDPDSILSISDQMTQHLCSLLRTWEIELFHLPSLWVLGNPIKTAQTFFFFFALEDNSWEESCGGLPPVEEGDRKINVIMELSTQVSLQTEKITQLEDVLEEKERKIQQLEAERGSQPFQEAEVSPECLQEAPISFNNIVTPVVSDEDM